MVPIEPIAGARSSWECVYRRPRPDAANSLIISPIVIFTLPGNPASLRSLPNLVGAELVDGAPRALDQSMRFVTMLRRSARDMRLALLGNSNNHGWGRTAVAWNVMTVPGWRDMSPDLLDASIQR
ncbi:MAG: hypothetical protein H0W30_09200 [Gemmatimonadaceae bacterium]|nr:hypothetical protein [Gemmatimonadaceae bacterium]